MFNPRWVFHATKPAQPVYSQAELDALGDGWADSPAAAGAPEERQTDDEIMKGLEDEQRKGAEQSALQAAIDAQADLAERGNREARAFIAAQEASARAEALANEEALAGTVDAVVVEHVAKAE
jgi:hypothetical protein